MPHISIIVPVYNVKTILRYCVESIIRQSYGDFEVLLIDDGSTDGSSTLCDELGRKDTRIRVFHKENGGLSDARNYGLARASGKFYMFIDSDDAVHKDFCMTLVKLQEQYNADIVSTQIKEFFDESELAAFDDAEHVSINERYNDSEILRKYYNPYVFTTDGGGG